MIDKLRLLFIVLSLILLTLPLHAAEDASWLYGKWQLVYDPDGASTDYLVFKENGDLISISEHGTYYGFYQVVPGAVRGVLTNNGKDLLLTFFYNEAKTELRIVTSASGVESVYKKVKQEQNSI